MTATDELRLLLDERGVEWYADDETLDDGSLSQVTYWHSNGIEWSADGRDEFLAFDAVQLITPEQAIAATLGDMPRLPYFWTADGTLHIELPKLPESISVRLPDQRDREMGSARTWQYTLDSGTCRYEIAFFGDGKAWFACSECGGMASADYDPPKYCPHCGRKVVGE